MKYSASLSSYTTNIYTNTHRQQQTYSAYFNKFIYYNFSYPIGPLHYQLRANSLPTPNKLRTNSEQTKHHLLPNCVLTLPHLGLSLRVRVGARLGLGLGWQLGVARAPLCCLGTSYHVWGVVAWLKMYYMKIDLGQLEMYFYISILEKHKLNSTPHTASTGWLDKLRLYGLTWQA